MPSLNKIYLIYIREIEYIYSFYQDYQLAYAYAIALANLTKKDAWEDSY